MNVLFRFIAWGWSVFNKVLAFFIPFTDLFVRVFIAKQFFYAGLTKIQTWDTTIFLFTHEYKIPLISPKLAALMGTATELTMPIFLTLGLVGRVPAFVLFIFNIVAVYSYPYLLTEEGQIGLNDHWYWGMLLLIMMCQGPGKISLDHLYQRLYRRRSSDIN